MASLSLSPAYGLSGQRHDPFGEPLCGELGLHLLPQPELSRAPVFRAPTSRARRTGRSPPRPPSRSRTSRAGSYYIDVSTSSPLTFDASALLTVTTNLSTTLGSSAGATDVGVTVTFSAVGSGGVPSYRSSSGPSATGPGSSTRRPGPRPIPSRARTPRHSVTVTVFDAVGNQATKAFTEAVNARPDVSTPTRRGPRRTSGSRSTSPRRRASERPRTSATPGPGSRPGAPARPPR